MNCGAANQLYVRADGRVPCNCDVGENITLFKPGERPLDQVDYIRDCYNGKPFQRLREAFAKGEPFVPACKDCYYFQPDAECEHPGVDGKLDEIDLVQIESSFNCPVECPACVPKAIRLDSSKSPLGKASNTMPDELFYKLVDDLAKNEMQVGSFLFCGRGEPLLHPRIGDHLRYVRSKLGNVYLTVHTSGNVPFREDFLEFDYITVSIDGARQESYEQYRVGGQIQRCFDLIGALVEQRRAPRHRFSRRRFQPLLALPDGKPWHLAKLPRRFLRYAIKRRPTLPRLPVICWKYVLFEHNDTPEEILEAQRMALELGVDEMQFVLSHTSNRSRRHGSMEDIARDPLFQRFDQQRVITSTVNESIENTVLWEDEEHRIEVRA